MCAVPNMAVFCTSLTLCFPVMLLKYFLKTIPIVDMIRNFHRFAITIKAPYFVLAVHQNRPEISEKYKLLHQDLKWTPHVTPYSALTTKVPFTVIYIVLNTATERRLAVRDLVSRVYSVAAILHLLFMVHTTLSSILNSFLLLH
jgi:hypothetical protein